MAKQHYCGFCGKAQDEVEQLLSGPCIEVCNECVDKMHEMMHKPKPILPLKPAVKPRKVISFNEEARKRKRC